MPKTVKFSSIYRTTWSSIKKQCDEKAIKACDFNKGLGPDLEKLEKFLEPLYELDEVPEKSLRKIETSVVDIQKTIRKYRDQIVQGNDKSPELGPSWRNLHQALLHIDEQLVGEVKDLGAKVAKLSGWLDKKDFLTPERIELEDDSEDGNKKATKKDKKSVSLPEEEEQEVAAQVLKKLKAHEDDPVKLLAVLGGKALGGCFTHSQALGEKVIRQGGAAKSAYAFIVTKLKENPPKRDLAEDALKTVQKAFEEIYELLGPESKDLKKFLNKVIVLPIRESLEER